MVIILQLGPTKRQGCRSCSHSNLKSVLNLGPMPLTARFLNEVSVSEEEPRYPLELVFCEDCTLLQVDEVPLPTKIFNKDYPYYSSVGTSVLEHSRCHVKDILKNEELDGNSLVIEVASNDGYLLQFLKGEGIPVLGIEPSAGPARVAMQKGIPTIQSFLTEDSAKEMANQGKQADILIAKNVLAHVADPGDFVRALKILLKPSGTLWIEVPYVRDLIEGCEFDTIYHEHVTYLSVHALKFLLETNGLFLNDVELLKIHGGSLRLKVQHQRSESPKVANIIKDEKARGVDRLEYYMELGGQVELLVKRFQDFVWGLKEKNMKLACYGAAAKGVIFLNYAQLGSEIFSYVLDKNPVKQGKYLPGVKLPVCNPDKLTEDQPDYTLILPWNFANEIKREQNSYLKKGGKFITAIPELQIHSDNGVQ